MDSSFLSFLCNNKISCCLCVLTSVEETEVRLRKKGFLTTFLLFGCNSAHIKVFSDKNVLLVQGIALSKHLYD